MCVYVSVPLRYMDIYSRACARVFIYEFVCVMGYVYVFIHVLCGAVFGCTSEGFLFFVLFRKKVIATLHLFCIISFVFIFITFFFCVFFSSNERYGETHDDCGRCDICRHEVVTGAEYLHMSHLPNQCAYNESEEVHHEDDSDMALNMYAEAVYAQRNAPNTHKDMQQEQVQTRHQQEKQRDNDQEMGDSNSDRDLLIEQTEETMLTTAMRIDKTSSSKEVRVVDTNTKEKHENTRNLNTISEAKIESSGCSRSHYEDEEEGSDSDIFQKKKEKNKKKKVISAEDDDSWSQLNTNLEMAELTEESTQNTIVDLSRIAKRVLHNKDVALVKLAMACLANRCPFCQKNDCFKFCAAACKMIFGVVNEADPEANRASLSSWCFVCSRTGKHHDQSKFCLPLDKVSRRNDRIGMCFAIFLNAFFFFFFFSLSFFLVSVNAFFW